MNQPTTDKKPRCRHGACKEAILASNPETITLPELAALTGLPRNSLRTAAFHMGILFKYARKQTNPNRIRRHA
jgi:hypothetical protein